MAYFRDHYSHHLEQLKFSGKMITVFHSWWVKTPPSR